MAIRCPYCEKSLTLKDPKPGRYTPKCTKCEKRFVLVVGDGEPVVMTAEAAQKAKPSGPPHGPAGSPDDIAATIAPSGTVVEKAPASPSTATVINETLAPSASDPLSTAAFTQANSRADDPNSTAAHFSVAPGPTSAATRVEMQATLAPGVSSNRSSDGAMPQQLGGYRIVKELGRGAMGAVYLARQVSLDRNVALKVIQSRLSDDPVFISRFTREAYAAAQLTHHNIVQVYDLGADKEINYFSMEFVEGQSLSALLKEQGKLDVETAVGYILQAARGLHFAHENGMVHRDIKPDNLMLNKHGVIKVADLGLVKTAGSAADDKASPATQSAVAQMASSTETAVNMAMGTPAYMPPEQSENAAGVDQRADIYSLGCTLYVLLTGKLPFEGATAMEVITKHKTQQIVRPDAIVKRVPPGLAEINIKMVEKRPADRYQSLAEVIDALEGFLGVQARAGFSPTEEHSTHLEKCVSQYNAPVLTKVRPLLGVGLLGISWLLSLTLLCNFPLVAAGFFALPLLTLVAYFVVSGVNERTHLFAKAREFVFSSRLFDWLLAFVGLALFFAALWLVGGIFGFVLLTVFCAIAVALACANYYAIDRQIASQRAKPLLDAEELLRTLRGRGVAEPDVRRFLVKYGGLDWEEFYEGLFGFEEKIAAREFLGRSEQDRRRKKFRVWREPMLRWIDERLKAVKEARERKHLARIEEKGLKAKGVSVAEARRQARESAEALVEGAAELRQAVAQPAPAGSTGPSAAEQKRARIKAMLAAARSQGKKKPASPLAAILAPLQFAFGAKMRFLVGAALVAGCAMWAQQNNLLSGVKDAAAKAIETKSLEGAGELTATKQETEPLKLPVLGTSFTGWFNSFNPGIAGLVLLVSSLFRGVKFSLFAIPSAAIILFGHTFIPLAFGTWVSLAIGLALVVLGILFGRTRAPAT